MYTCTFNYFGNLTFIIISFLHTYLFLTDIILFEISNFVDTFVESMNQDDIIFNSRYILESLASMDPGFIFNLAHNNDNNITGIVWMTSYMRDNFERFDNYISIDIMYSSIRNAKKFC